MLQNTMLTRFLRLGSLLIILFFIGCNSLTQHEYIVKADFIYINQTDLIIEVKDVEDNSFKLLPDSSFIYRIETEGSKNPDPNDYHTPYEYRGAIILIMGKEYPMYMGAGITGILNYEAEKIERNYYRFTYVFNEDTIPKDFE